jgi:hypothetical protein
MWHQIFSLQPPLGTRYGRTWVWHQASGMVAMGYLMTIVVKKQLS